MNRTIMFETFRYVVVQHGVVMSQKDKTFHSKLVLHAVTEQDSGLYVCAATNLQGFKYLSAYLTVIPGLKWKFAYNNENMDERKEA